LQIKPFLGGFEFLSVLGGCQQIVNCGTLLRLRIERNGKTSEQKPVNSAHQITSNRIEMCWIHSISVAQNGCSLFNKVLFTITEFFEA
jgi:hypothetical protein